MTAVQPLAPSALAPAAPAAAPRRLRSLSPHLLLVANGNASGLSRRPHLVEDSARLLRSAGARVETRVTTTLEELDDALALGERRVVLLGGDGSIHAAANADGPKPELALIPAGGANNVARSLHIPVDVADAAKIAVESAAQPLDLIAVETPKRRMLAVEGISVGYHSVARSGYHGTNSADVAAGAAAAAKALADFEPRALAIESDGAIGVMSLNQLFVVNFPLFAFGLHVAPAADPSDGLLDLVALEASSRASLVAMLARMRHGTHVGRRGVRMWQAERVRIFTGGRWPIVADTTSLGTGPAEIGVEPAALSIVRPGR